jgi:electron transfer flavoprotein alpha/beta subunit
VDSIVIIQDETSHSVHESIRCLDWSMNHQIRKAREVSHRLPVFIPTMKKIKASVVVLSAEQSDKEQLLKNVRGMGLDSLALVSETGKVSKEWSNWAETLSNTIYLCEGCEVPRGKNS